MERIICYDGDVCSDEYLFGRVSTPISTSLVFAQHDEEQNHHIDQKENSHHIQGDFSLSLEVTVKKAVMSTVVDVRLMSQPDMHPLTDRLTKPLCRPKWRHPRIFNIIKCCL